MWMTSSSEPVHSVWADVVDQLHSRMSAFESKHPLFTQTTYCKALYMQREGTQSATLKKVPMDFSCELLYPSKEIDYTHLP